MEITVLVKNAERRDLLLGACNFFARRLKIRRAPYGLIVLPVPGLHKKYEYDALIAEVEPRLLMMVLDTSQKLGNQLQAVAHEFVHAQQIIKGTLVFDTWKKDSALFWKGENLTHLPHHERPWEIEAMSKEVVLMHQFNGKMSDVVAKAARPRRK